MFVEMSREAYLKIADKLKSNNYQFEVSDCTLPDDNEQYVHIEFMNLTEANIRDIAKELDLTYAQLAEESRKEEEITKEELADKDEHKETAHNKWEDEYHTPLQEMKGYLTGKSSEVEYY